MNRHSKPCSDPDVAEELECAGDDGICYGKPFYDKRPFQSGEAKPYKFKSRCEYIEQTRQWWCENMRAEP